jgi:hypothetical protein
MQLSAVSKSLARPLAEYQSRLGGKYRPFLGLIMIGMRNKLIHEYGDVDWDVVWDTTQLDVPPLVATLEGIVPSDPAE